MTLLKADHPNRQDAAELKPAEVGDLAVLLSLVKAYHDFEGITATDSDRKKALSPLLEKDSTLGKVWLIKVEQKVVGYIALCFGYTIEFGGRDAFIDEFYMMESARGKGVGQYVLKTIKTKARECGVRALHLEVAHSNKRAKESYEKAGFISRQGFHLMSMQLADVKADQSTQ